MTDKQLSEEEQAHLDFESGFSPETTTKKADAAEAKPEAKPEPPKTEAKPAVKTEPKADPKKPEFVRLTKEEHESLKASAAKLPDLEKKLDKAFGTMGGMQQIMRELQNATPKGEAVEITDDIVAELKKEFPELADPIKAALTAALKGRHGTGKADATLSEDAIKAMFETRAVKREIEALEDAHPNWREKVGVNNEGGHDPKHPYRIWLAKQPADYQTKINQTNNAAVIARSIDKFEADQAAAKSQPVKKPTPKIVMRQNRIKSATQPKGDGGQPGPSKSEVDHFNDGFRTG